MGSSALTRHSTTEGSSLDDSLLIYNNGHSIGINVLESTITSRIHDTGWAISQTISCERNTHKAELYSLSQERGSSILGYRREIVHLSGLSEGELAL